MTTTEPITPPRAPSPPAPLRRVLTIAVPLIGWIVLDVLIEIRASARGSAPSS